MKNLSIVLFLLSLVSCASVSSNIDKHVQVLEESKTGGKIQWIVQDETFGDRKFVAEHVEKNVMRICPNGYEVTKKGTESKPYHLGYMAAQIPYAYKEFKCN